MRQRVEPMKYAGVLSHLFLLEIVLSGNYEDAGGNVGFGPVARSFTCAYKAARSVKGEMRVSMALCWNPIGIGGSPGPIMASA